MTSDREVAGAVQRPADEVQMKIGDTVDMRSCATEQALGIPEAAPPGRTMKFLYLGLDDGDWPAVIRGELPKRQ